MTTTTLTRRQTTQAIKRALLAHSHPGARATSGKGTGWGWIRVDIDRNRDLWPEYRDQYRVAQEIATKAAQREYMHGEYGSQINIHIHDEVTA